MTATHVHRWRIDTPNGPTSRGACACGAERLFGNSEEQAVAFREMNRLDGVKRGWQRSNRNGRLLPEAWE